MGHRKNFPGAASFVASTVLTVPIEEIIAGGQATNSPLENGVGFGPSLFLLTNERPSVKQNLHLLSPCNVNPAVL